MNACAVADAAAAPCCSGTAMAARCIRSCTCAVTGGMTAAISSNRSRASGAARAPAALGARLRGASAAPADHDAVGTRGGERQQTTCGRTRNQRFHRDQMRNQGRQSTADTKCGLRNGTTMRTCVHHREIRIRTSRCVAASRSAAAAAVLRSRSASCSFCCSASWRCKHAGVSDDNANARAENSECTSGGQTAADRSLSGHCEG
jgi:hypothetical protein